MRWGGLTRAVAAAAIACATAGCERLGLGPHEAKSAAPPAAPTAPDLAPYAGKAYAEFVAEAGMGRFAPQALPLTEAEAAQVETLLGRDAVGRMVSGGGTAALVFSGCARAGCGAGSAVLAIEQGTGGAFVGVRGPEGAEVLVPNARVEALLRLTSPTGSWDEPPSPAAPPE